MPIYEYQCDSCGSQRELILRHGEVARPTCAACRKRMRRVISKTAFILKGSGWYVTDYPSDARKKGLQGRRPPPRPGPPGRRRTPRARSRRTPPRGRCLPRPRKKPAAAEKRPGAAAGSAKRSRGADSATLSLAHDRTSGGGASTCEYTHTAGQSPLKSRNCDRHRLVWSWHG